MGDAFDFARKVGALFGLSFFLLLGGQEEVFAQTCPPPNTLRLTSFEREFIQEKFMSGRQKPLLSKGRFVLEDDTVTWHMTEPFDVKTVIAPERITQSVDGGAAEPLASGAGQIGARVASSMAAMMRGEWEELEALFNVTILPLSRKDDWVVKLMPRDKTLAGVLGAITVRGCSDVSMVEIARADDDRDVIRFKEVPGGVR